MILELIIWVVVVLAVLTIVGLAMGGRGEW